MTKLIRVWIALSCMALAACNGNSGPVDGGGAAGGAGGSGSGGVGGGTGGGGAGGVSNLVCSPASLEFGMVAVGVPLTRTFACVNHGDEPLAVQAVHSTHPRFSAQLWRRAGSDVDAFTVDVTFDPLDEGWESGMIVIETRSSDGGVGVMPVSALGRKLPPCLISILPPFPPDSEFGSTFPTSTAGLEFGIVEVGDSVSRFFEIKNLLETECLINNLEVRGPRAFRMEPIESLVLSGKKTRAFPVFFTPYADQMGYVGSIRFQISNPTEPNQIVWLHGGESKPCANIDPEEIDFGSAELGCRTPDRHLTITNVCARPIALGSWGWGGTWDLEAFQLRTWPPHSLGSNERADITLSFRPMAVGASWADSFLQFDDGLSDFSVALRGEGRKAKVKTDVFRQADPPDFPARFFLRDQPSDSNGDGVVDEEDLSVDVDGAPTAAVGSAGERVWAYDRDLNAIDFTPLDIPGFGSEISVSYRVGCFTD